MDPQHDAQRAQAYRKEDTKGRAGYNQNDICKERIRQMMTNDPEYRALMEKHHWGSNEGEKDVTPPKVGDLGVINVNYHEERVGNIKRAIHRVEQKMKLENHPSIGTQLDQTMLQFLLAEMEVAEFYSPPIGTQLAREMGLDGA